MMNLDDLVGKEVGFCGVDHNAFCVKFEGKRYAFEAIEDESDGHRSMLECVAKTTLKGHIFFKDPIITLVIEKVDEFKNNDVDALDGYVLRDPKTNHVWLLVGTDRYDSYYPCFVVRYVPEHVCHCKVCGRQIAT